MVEAGADEVPEDDDPRGVRRSRTTRSGKICDALEELRCAGRQAEVGRSRADRRARARARPRDLGAHPAARAPRGAARSSTSSLERARPADHDGLDRGRHRPRAAGARRASTLILEKQRLVAVEGPVREQFEADLRALTEAEQDSKELKSAQAVAALRPDRRGASSCRSRSGRPPSRARRRSSRTRSRSSTSSGPPRRSTRTSSARRSPSRSGARTAAAPRRSGRSSARSPSRRGRTARRSSRAARRRS